MNRIVSDVIVKIIKLAYRRNGVGKVFHSSDCVPGEKLGCWGTARVKLCVVWGGWFCEETDFLECRIGNCQLCQGSYSNALGIVGCVCVRRRGGKRVCCRWRWVEFCAWYDFWIALRFLIYRIMRHVRFCHIGNMHVSQVFCVSVAAFGHLLFVAFGRFAAVWS